MNYTRYLTTFLFIALIICTAKSQNQPVPPKIEMAFDSVYPKATYALWEDQALNNTNRRVSFNCNCQEGSGHLKITFDANGNIVNKDMDISKNDLPGNIINYIESNYPNTGFMYGEITKVAINTGTPSYRVELLQMNPDGTVTDGGWIYILKFTSSGEFISVDKRLQNN
jgi:hypothetical protein